MTTSTISRIHITGASGSGTTTLGRGIAKALGWTHIDSDEVYWMKTDPPYLRQYPEEQRRQRLRERLPANRWVVSGSLVGWADPFATQFDLVLWPQLPAPQRLARLEERERRVFGARMDSGGDMESNLAEFLTWARRYDEGGLDVRSHARHAAWIAEHQLPCVVLDASQPTEAVLEDALQAIANGTNKGGPTP